MNTTNPHADHRLRLKQRFLTEGLDGFDVHNVLELLLFYTIPRRDTNVIAHSLIDRFGSLYGVFDAEFHELCEIKGVSVHTASLIKLIPQIWRRYETEKYSSSRQVCTAKDAGDYLLKLYIGEKKEVAYMLLFDNSNRMFDCVKLQEGDISSVYFSPRALMEVGALRGAASFILAHNHVDGSLEPSKRDVVITRRFKEAFDVLEMPMLAHIIVANNAYKIIPTYNDR